ncbi:DUF454 domain-containing protein [archaeon]|nr:MAG: DUF454 domain-containing protein [archaeon]
MRGVLIVSGSVSVGLGVIGIFVPILPTTPFLLLAAGCYARSSDRFYNWLLGNRLFGNYIRNYREGRGIPLVMKIAIILLLWVTILFSAFMVVTSAYVQVILLIIAAAVSMHIALLKTKNEKGGP